MKRRGIGVIKYIVLLILIISGDSSSHPSGKYMDTAFIAAAIEVDSHVQTTQAQPGIIPLEQTLQNTPILQNSPALQDTPTAQNSPALLDSPSSPNIHTMEDASLNNSSLQNTPDKTVALTLMTFNIRSANNENGSVELEKIIEEIRETEADIVGLQEVERMMPRSGYQDQARIIAEELGYHYYYGGNINILGVQYGNALLSKYPIIEASNHKLPKEKLEPRGMIEADIDIDGSQWHIYVTHLGLNSKERNKQIDYINQVISQRSGNILLMGDFNNYPDSLEMDGLDERMVDSAAALNCFNYYTFAWQNDKPNVRIDRIYVSENIDLINHEVKSSTVSDHERVLTQISLNVLQEGGI